MYPMKSLKVCMLLAPLALLNACGDGSSSSSASAGDAGSFSLAITDGPIDSAVAVVVEITGVTIKPADGEPVEVVFDAPKSINLLDLQGSASADLISELALTAGEYDWVSVQINAVEDGVLDSYIEFEDGTIVELDMPAGAEAGLKIVRHFTIVEGEESEFTIDFDLRKSVIHSVKHLAAKLMPTMRMVHNKRAGHIHGEIDAALVAEQCADPATELGAVYVFEGADAVPTDVNGQEGGPIASALVKLDDDGEYEYRIGFLEEGEYTVAYTCDAINDDPEQADDLLFAVLEPLTVEAKHDHDHGFGHKAKKYHHWKNFCETEEETTDDDSEVVDDIVDDEVVDDVEDEVVDEVDTDSDTTVEDEAAEDTAVAGSCHKWKGLDDEDDASDDDAAGDDAAAEDSDDTTEDEAVDDDATEGDDTVEDEASEDDDTTDDETDGESDQGEATDSGDTTTTDAA